MFPTEWETQTGAKRKRRAPDEPGPERDHCPPDEPPPSDRIEDLRLPQLILRSINTSPKVPAVPGELDLDAILSRVPYRDILENLYGREEYARGEVPVVSRAYEEAFLREPMPGERPCVSGELCECMFIDRACPFVAAELRLPNDPDTAQMCVLCSRATTQKCFYDMCYLGKPVKGVIQRYGCIFGQPGEYATECMLVCPRTLGMASMPVPSMSHQRNRYSVVCHGGAKHLRQHRVAHEDFQPPPSTGPAW